jgi:P27 family predicted phage terminase small subunit
MAGRKPKPTHLHVIEGTLHTSRHRKRATEPKPVGELVDPPGWMSASQKDVWHYALEHAPRGLLKKLDGSALTVWVVACDLHRQASEQLANLGAAGLLYKTPANGMLIQSPLVGTVNRQATIMLKAAAELGFSPTSRGRVSVSDNARKGGPAAEFFDA